MKTLMPLGGKMHGRRSPALRLLGVVAATAVTIFLYWDLHYGHSLFGAPDTFSDNRIHVLLQLGSQLAITFPLYLFVVAYLIPAVTRRQAQSPIVIAIDNNRLILKGEGRHSGEVKLIELQGSERFSSDTLLINQPRKLEEAINNGLGQFKLRLKPKLIVMPFDHSLPRSLNEDEIDLLQRVSYSAGASEVVIVDGTSPQFNHRLPELCCQKEAA